MYCSSVWAAAGAAVAHVLELATKILREKVLFSIESLSRDRRFFFRRDFSGKIFVESWLINLFQSVTVFFFFFVFSLLLLFEVKREKTSYLSYHRLKKRLTSILARYVWSKEGERGGERGGRERSDLNAGIVRRRE